MNSHFIKAMKLTLLWAAVTLLSACDQPLPRGALTFYGECISDVSSDCMTIAPLATGQPFVVNREPIVEPRHFADAEVVLDERYDEVVIFFTLNAEGTARFGEATAARIGKMIFMLDEGHLITAPTVREPIASGRGQIVAEFTEEQANDLVARILANSEP